MWFSLAGNNNGGQLGYELVTSIGTESSTMGDKLQMVDLGREQTAVAIAAGAYHSCALLNTGQLKCWGECCVWSGRPRNNQQSRFLQP